MKLRVIFQSFIILIVIGSFLIGCSNPLTGNQQSEYTTDSETDGNNVKVTIPTVSPLFVDALSDQKEEDQYSSRSFTGDSASRAFAFASSAEVRLYNSEGTLIDTQTASDNSVMNGSIEITFNSISSGQGYYIEVDVYNNIVSSINPIVSGTSEPFSISPDQITSVTVGLTPNSPDSSLTAGSTETITIQSSVADVENQQFTSFGGEKWYEITPSQGTIGLNVAPDSTSHAFVGVFNSDGSNIDMLYSPGLMESPEQYGTSISSIVNVTPGATHYIGVFNAAEVSESHTLDVTWTDGNPITADGKEVNDSLSDAKSVSLNTTETLTFHESGDVDWFSFDATTGNRYVFQTSSTGQYNVDTELYLYDIDGTTELQYNDDVGDSLYSALVLDCSTSGTYYIKVQEFEGGMGEYNLSVEPPTEGTLTLELLDASTFNNNNLYFVVVPQGASPTDSTNYLADGTGTVTNGSVTITAQEYGSTTDWTGAGIYDVYFLVDMDNSGFDSATVGDYRSYSEFFIDGNTTQTGYGSYFEYLPPEDSYEPDDTLGDAGMISVGETQNRSFHFIDTNTNDTSDWVTFTATGGQTYIISTSEYGNGNVDTELTLYDGTGTNELEYNDDKSSDSLYSEITWTAPSDGTYAIKVTELDASMGEYSLALSQ